MTIHMWAPNWQNRIIRAAQSMGFANLTELLSSMPSVPYDEIADCFENVAPIQILDVQFMEAREAGRVREAANDSLCRVLSQYLPDGWGLGDKADRDANHALAIWASGIEVTGECEELGSILDAVCDALYRLPPKRGWHPTGPDDPLIEFVFNSHWPTAE